MTEFTTDSIFQALKSLLAVVDNDERRRQIEAYIEAALGVTDDQRQRDV